MAIFIGLDVGTSKLAAVALNSDGQLLARASRGNTAEVPGLPPGRREQSPETILALSMDLLRDIRQELGHGASAVRGIGLTGQMHGVLLCDRALRPLTNLITWQDRRAEDEFPGTAHSYLDECIRRVGRGALEPTGTTWATGYMGATLFWLQETGAIPPGTRWALMVHDWIAARLGRFEPATDPTDAASSGLYSVRAWEWAPAIAEPLGIDPRILPVIREAGNVLGRIPSDLAEATGLPAGVTVHTALGDNQASVLASMRDPAHEVMVNVGTGGQTSAVTEKLFVGPDLEARPFPGRRILSCGMGLCGGAAFAYLAEHYARVIREMTGTDVPLSAVLSRLVELAANVPPGAHGLCVEPLFHGKRSAPQVRGSMSGMSGENNDPGAWARAFLEGMARHLAGHYHRMCELGLEPRTRLVLTGNAMRRNPVLREAAKQAFGLPVTSPVWEEEAACGAALVAMVGSGALPSFDAAASLVPYPGESAHGGR